MFKFIITAFVLLSFNCLANPLVQISWHNQNKSSEIIIHTDGNVEHKENIVHRPMTVNEKALSKDELSKIEKLVEELTLADSKSKKIRATLGSMAGGIEVMIGSEMKMVEGIERVNTNSAIEHKSKATAAAKDMIKLFNQYAKVKMP